MDKGEISCNYHFLLFPQCLLVNQIIVSPFVHIFDTISLFATKLEELKISQSGQGLKNINENISLSNHQIGTQINKKNDI